MVILKCNGSWVEWVVEESLVVGGGGGFERVRENRSLFSVTRGALSGVVVNLSPWLPRPYSKSSVLLASVSFPAKYWGISIQVFNVLF